MCSKKMLSGKANPDILESLIFPYLGVPDENIIIPPSVGFDAGVFRHNKSTLGVIATDPVLGVPIEYFGFFMFHFVASDVAVFGAKPKYLIDSITFPENYNLNTIKKIFSQLHKECLKYNSTILTGHTGFYSSVITPIASSTILGFVNKNNLVLPSGAKPGDKILLTKNLGLEVAVMMTFSNPNLLETFTSLGDISYLKSQITGLTVVPEALLLSEYSLVNAMHDVTEGGLSTALPEMANASKLGFIIYEEKIPIHSVVKQIASEYEVNPLAFSSTGTLLAAVPSSKADTVQQLLTKNKIQNTIIGEFTDNPKDRKIRNNISKEEKAFPEFLQDPYSRLINL